MTTEHVDAPSEGLSLAEMHERNRQMSKKFIAVIIGMTLFAFGSIPLYRIVCDRIDPGGSSWSNGTADAYQGVAVNKSRKVKVNFVTNVNRQLPWTFNGPEDTAVHPGERRRVVFRAHNVAEHTVRGKAVYDINPPEAGQYFKKIECFCFQEQSLDEGKSADMPLIFWFDPKMPDSITEVTVAYTFFNMETSLDASIKKAKQP